MKSNEKQEVKVAGVCHDRTGGQTVERLKLDFLVNWGYSMPYSRRLYHPVYCWDGHLELSEAGANAAVWLLNYPNCWWAFCYDPVETPMANLCWQQSTRRRIAGIHVVAECGPGCGFKLVTASGTFECSAEQILAEGRIVFSVGPKYGFCSVVVNRKDYYWFRPGLAEGQARFESADLPLPHCHHRHYEMAVLAPGAEFSVPFELSNENVADGKLELLCHLRGMILSPEKLSAAAAGSGGAIPCQFAEYVTPDGDLNHAAAEVDLEFAVTGGPRRRIRHYFRFHDFEVQLLEDLWARLELEPGSYHVTLRNLDTRYPLHIAQLLLSPVVTRHLQLTLPRWALAGREQIGRVFASRRESVAISMPCRPADRSSPLPPAAEAPGPDVIPELRLEPGWNEFRFTPQQPVRGQELVVRSAGGAENRGEIDAVYLLEDESPELLVGYDMTTVPHDGFGDLDWLLDHTFRTQLANTVVFRAFRPYPVVDAALLPSADLFQRWGTFCREHRMHVQSVNCHASGVLARSAGEFMHNAGLHEYTGAVYAADPDDTHASSDMREASQKFIDYLRQDIEKEKAAGIRHAYGDASGGSRYAYMAGSQYARVETMVSHTQHVCSLQRPVAEIFGRGDWGVHIALQHAMQPHHRDWHLGMYYLALAQPWAMGASNLYEEDSLFTSFKDVIQGWDDELPRSKRDLTRDFLRFVKTHPRRGRILRPIASLEGRYAAPFNGFVCGPEQDPSYTVWGLFGSKSKAWAHGQPEKAHQLLDVLMPGASTHPFRQAHDRRRFFFSGTPFGDFDQVPIEADAAYLGRYRLILHLGWNTLIDEDYEKLRAFVRQGGRLFTGLPQFSTHVKRDFLLDMADLALYRDGDLRELCGLRVLGRGQRFSGTTTPLDGFNYPRVAPSRQPSFSRDEDGPCHLAEIELCGAVPLVADVATGKPLLVANRYGAGVVYTLTTWCYPGHEALGEIAAALVSRFCGESLADLRIEQDCSELFWNVRELEEDHSCVTILNTDWTRPGNVKQARLITPRRTVAIQVKEREIKLIHVIGGTVLEPSHGLHLERTGPDEVNLHGAGRQSLRITDERGSQCLALDFSSTTLLTFRLTGACLMDARTGEIPKSHQEKTP